MTKKDLIKIIKSCGIKEFNVTEKPGEISVYVQKVRWFSFVKKHRIKKLKGVLKRCIPVSIFCHVQYKEIK